MKLLYKYTKHAINNWKHDARMNYKIIESYGNTSPDTVTSNHAFHTRPPIHDNNDIPNYKSRDSMQFNLFKIDSVQFLATQDSVQNLSIKILCYLINLFSERNIF